MQQTAPVADTLSDTLGVTMSDAPSQVLEVKLDSALLNEFAVATPPLASPERSVSPLVPLGVGGVLILVVLGARALARADLTVQRAYRRLMPGSETPPPARHEPEPRVSSRPQGPDPSTWRSTRKPKVAEPIRIPPHVAAMLARMEERRAQEQAALDADEPPGPTQTSGSGGGLDVWIGR